MAKKPIQKCCKTWDWRIAISAYSLVEESSPDSEWRRRILMMNRVMARKIREPARAPREIGASCNKNARYGGNPDYVLNNGC